MESITCSLPLPSCSCAVFQCLSRGNCHKEEVFYLFGSSLEPRGRLHCASASQLLTCHETDIRLAGVCVNVPVRKEKKYCKRKENENLSREFPATNVGVSKHELNFIILSVGRTVILQSFSRFR